MRSTTRLSNGSKLMMPSSDLQGGATGLRSIIGAVEWAAALLMGLVTLLAFASAFMRYVAGLPIPDAHDFGRLALGIAIFWGVASVNFSGSHISVDLIYEAVGKGWRRAMDIVATMTVAGSFAVLTVMMAQNAADVFATKEHSYDLRLVIWPAYWMMVAGAGLATVTALLRLWLLIRAPGEDADGSTRHIEE